MLVFGYQGEPYLRIGPRGTWQNDRSPAVFLNRTRIPTREAPHDQYDAKATPRWRKISSAPVASWHDHRTHWMATDDPPEVRRDPGSTHVVIAELEDPAADPGPRGRGAGRRHLRARAVAVAVGPRRRRARDRRRGARAGPERGSAVMQATLAVLIVSETMHVVGAWQATTASIGSRALASIYSIGGIVVCGLALVVAPARTRGPRRPPC